MNSAAGHLLEFTMNKVLFKIFGAMPKDPVAKYVNMLKNQFAVVRKKILTDMLGPVIFNLT